MSITTTNGEIFTYSQHAELAYIIFVRFGRNLSQASSAWRRLMQNNTTEKEFQQLLDSTLDKPALDYLEELLSITSQYKNNFGFHDYDQWQRISSKCVDLREGL